MYSSLAYLNVNVRYLAIPSYPLPTVSYGYSVQFTQQLQALRKIAEYMRQRFCFLAYPGPESPQPAPLLDIPVDQTIAIHQMVTKLAEAYRNQSEYVTSSSTVRFKYYVCSSVRY